MSKYDRGICHWRGCNKPRVPDSPDTPHKFKDETWILPFYCQEHGKTALANRIAKITEYKRKELRHNE